MKNQNPILVSQFGKINTKFIVKDPKKIEFWKMMSQRVSPIAILIKTEYIELK